jgi:hypothetical protein
MSNHQALTSELYVSLSVCLSLSRNIILKSPIARRFPKYV